MAGAVAASAGATVRLVVETMGAMADCRERVQAASQRRRSRAWRSAGRVRQQPHELSRLDRPDGRYPVCVPLRRRSPVRGVARRRHRDSEGEIHHRRSSERGDARRLGRCHRSSAAGWIVSVDLSGGTQGSRTRPRTVSCGSLSRGGRDRTWRRADHRSWDAHGDGSGSTTVPSRSHRCDHSPGGVALRNRSSRNRAAAGCGEVGYRVRSSSRSTRTWNREPRTRVALPRSVRDARSPWDLRRQHLHLQELDERLRARPEAALLEQRLFLEWLEIEVLRERIHQILV